MGLFDFRTGLDGMQFLFALDEVPTGLFAPRCLLHHAYLLGHIQGEGVFPAWGSAGEGVTQK